MDAASPFSCDGARGVSSGPSTEDAHHEHLSFAHWSAENHEGEILKNRLAVRDLTDPARNRYRG